MTTIQYRLWSPAGGVDVQVESLPDPGKEGESRVQQIGEAQLKIGVWGGRKDAGRRGGGV